MGCLAYTVRYCTKEYKIPGSDFVIPKGTKVFIPIVSCYGYDQTRNNLIKPLVQAGLHYDPKYWKNPDVFDPERFSSENKSSIDPITFQTFGSGPRYVFTPILLFMIYFVYDNVFMKTGSAWA